MYIGNNLKLITKKMNISELFDLMLEENIDLELIGEISLDDDDSIKWEYDGLGKCDDDMEEHLQEVYDEDKGIIEDFLWDNSIDEDFFINEPDFDESSVYFYITEE